MNYLVGACLIAVGLVVALFGDRTVQAPEKGGIVSKLFAWPKSQVSYMKWPMGAAIAGIGIWFILYGADKL